MPSSEATAAEQRALAAKVPDRIILAAAEVMERQGFQQSSLREIALAAGISKPGLYYHAPSKEFVLFAIHDRFASWLIERGEEILDSDLSTSDKLRELVRVAIEGMPRFRALGIVFLREYRHVSGELRTIIDQQRHRYLQIYEEIIDAGRHTGEFSAGDNHLDALTLIGAVNWASFWFDPDGKLNADEVADYLANRMLSGLLARDEESIDSGGRP